MHDKIANTIDQFKLTQSPIPACGEFSADQVPTADANLSITPRSSDICSWLQEAPHLNLLSLPTFEQELAELEYKQEVPSRGNIDTIPSQAASSSGEFLPSIHFDEFENAEENDKFATPRPDRRPCSLRNIDWTPSARQELIFKDLLFMEGSSDLQILPAILVKQLAYGMGINAMNVPECVRARNNISIFVRSSDRKGEAWFADMRNDETLLAAKYSYPDRGQIVVVRRVKGLLSNGADAAIVTHCRQFSTVVSKHDKIITYTNFWKIWDPLQSATVDHYVKRVSTPQLSRNKLQVQSRSITASSAFDQTPAAPQNFKSHENTAPVMKYWLRERKPLIPKLCSAVGTSSRKKKSNAIQAVKSPLRVDRETSQKLSIKLRLGSPQTSSTVHHKPYLKLDREPLFVFKKSPNDPQPRSRSLSICNSAEKLYANAIAAGVASQSTFLLKAEVIGYEPIRVVRGDKEDFHAILQLLENVNGGHALIIVVTAEEFDL